MTVVAVLRKDGLDLIIERNGIVLRASQPAQRHADREKG